MRFRKYQGLGNDYIVLERADLRGADLPAALIRRICDRHYGVGSDGILVEDATPDGRLALRIFNPDGSEAEKSGNGLRIFARYLWDGPCRSRPLRHRHQAGPCGARSATAGGWSSSRWAWRGSTADIPVAGPPREVVGEPSTPAASIYASPA